MLRLLIVFMSPRSVDRAILNLLALMVPLNALAYVTQKLILAGPGLSSGSLVLLTTMVGLPFMIGGQMIGARQAILYDRLKYMATTDMLTSLRNRRAFIETAQSAIDKQKGVLLLLDADHFKKVNDTYGHAAGDKCLKALAEYVSGLVRSTDITGRVGGEEFAIFLAGARMEDAEGVGKRLSRGLRVEIEPSVHVKLTASVGAAFVPIAADIDDVMRDADIALYKAKENGRARLEIAA